jgi:hypothetical protein
MLSNGMFWLGVFAGSMLGLIFGVAIGIRLYLRTGRW